MFIGPVFSRELVTAPRRPGFYIGRVVYVGTLLLLLSTAWLVLTGTQTVRTIGDLARFGQIAFQILAPLQLALALFFSALFTASSVAQEKDKGTLDLLLMTSLSNHELVLGKLCASLLGVLTLWAAGIPFFAAMVLFGGVSFDQVARMSLITLVAILAAGSIGSTLALWREKTFQTLALTALVAAAWLGAGELVAAGALGKEPLGLPADQWAAGLSPVRAVQTAALGSPIATADHSHAGSPLLLFLACSGAIMVLLNGVAIARVRRWNPVQEVRPQRGRESISPLQEDEFVVASPGEIDSRPPSPNPSKQGVATGQSEAVHRAPGKVRQVWTNPVLWREVRTWSLGRKILLIRLAYAAIFVLAAVAAYRIVHGDRAAQAGALGFLLAPLFVLSIVLVNAVAVTTVTSERDGKTLDLLLVTDLTAKEFIFGKLAGVFYVAKEMVLFPFGICIYLAVTGALSWENLAYVLGGLAVMFTFAAVLGLHAGMTYQNSRTAIGISLGTVFFLFLGIATCMRIMVAFSGSFQLQLAPFLAFMLGGGLGLFFALGIRNPSPAIFIASLICPIATFWAMTSFLQHETLGVFIVTALTYGFATAALLIPAIFEFDVATGRTTGGAD